LRREDSRTLFCMGPRKGRLFAFKKAGGGW
jgi:hypothetical protein